MSGNVFHSGYPGYVGGDTPASASDFQLDTAAGAVPTDIKTGAANTEDQASQGLFGYAALNDRTGFTRSATPYSLGAFNYQE